MSCRRTSLAATLKKMFKTVIQNLGDPVTLKIVTTANPGDPAKGEAPTYAFTFRRSRAVIDAVQQTDILYSGGIYQIGDIHVEMNDILREVIVTNGHIGDRMVWNGTEYRVLGKRQPETVQGSAFLYRYAMRPVSP